MAKIEPYYEKCHPAEPPAGPRQPFHAVLDNLRSAYNVGSIFRTADAAAVERLHLCGLTTYPPNVKLAKTALGAMEYVPWTHYRDTREALAGLRRLGIPLVAVEVIENAVPHTEFRWPKPVAAVFGHEVTGIAPDILALCDHRVCIPLLGYKNSINVATAFGIIVYEVLRQWRAAAPER